MNVGASATSVAAGFNGELTLGVYPQYGLGENLAGLLQETEIDNIMRWMQLDISQNTLREYLFQKSLYPSAIPATKEEQSLAQSVAQQALYLAVRKAQKDFPAHARSVQNGVMPPFGSDYRRWGRDQRRDLTWTKSAVIARRHPAGWDNARLT